MVTPHAQWMMTVMGIMVLCTTNVARIGILFEAVLLNVVRTATVMACPADFRN